MCTTFRIFWCSFRSVPESIWNWVCERSRCIWRLCQMISEANKYLVEFIFLNNTIKIPKHHDRVLIVVSSRSNNQAKFKTRLRRSLYSTIQRANIVRLKLSRLRPMDWGYLGWGFPGFGLMGWSPLGSEAGVGEVSKIIYSSLSRKKFPGYRIGGKKYLPQ